MIPKTVIGIDPGLTGAITFLKLNGPGFEAWVEDMPILPTRGNRKVKNEVAAYHLADMLRYVEDPVVFIEDVYSRSKQGVATVFSLGDTRGAIRGVCAGAGLYVTMVQPKEWKSIFGLKSNKEEARLLAIKKFPELADDLQRKKDHNRAESALIALYGARLVADRLAGR